LQSTNPRKGSSCAPCILEFCRCAAGAGRPPELGGERCSFGEVEAASIRSRAPDEAVAQAKGFSKSPSGRGRARPLPHSARPRTRRRKDSGVAAGACRRRSHDHRSLRLAEDAGCTTLAPVPGACGAAPGNLPRRIRRTAP
jgi:hypothetical protein